MHFKVQLIFIYQLNKILGKYKANIFFRFHIEILSLHLNRKFLVYLKLVIKIEIG